MNNIDNLSNYLSEVDVTLYYIGQKVVYSGTPLKDTPEIRIPLYYTLLCPKYAFVI